MVQQLRVLPSPQEDLSLIPNMHVRRLTTTFDFIFNGYNTIFRTQRTSAHQNHTCTQLQVQRIFQTRRYGKVAPQLRVLTALAEAFPGTHISSRGSDALF